MFRSLAAPFAEDDVTHHWFVPVHADMTSFDTGPVRMPREWCGDNGNTGRLESQEVMGTILTRLALLTQPDSAWTLS